jgi:sulfate adenylyltransferase
MTDDLVRAAPSPLVDLMVGKDRREEIEATVRESPSWNLTPRQLCDLELLLVGAFSPLRGFLGRADYESVRDGLRLADGALWPIPVVLDVPEAFARALPSRPALVLRDPEGVALAVLHVSEVFRPDRREEAERVYGTSSRSHPGVAHLLDRTGDHYLGGVVEGLDSPRHYDFRSLRRTPSELRAEFARRGWRSVVAFQTRNPMHRAHYEMTVRALRGLAGGGLLLHPSVGLTAPGDVDHYTRVRAYQALLGRYPAGAAALALLPLSMRMAGPREAVWHALIRRNYGCSHFIVGRDHAGPGDDPGGRPFYAPYAAQDLVGRHQGEMGIRMVPFRSLVYVEDRDAFVPEDEVPAGSTAGTLSGTELRARLADGRGIPEWFTFPEVAEELRRRHPPRARQGLTVFFTGLSGAGKSTIANVLRVKVLERGGRPVTLLDGDVVRKSLSRELGFSKADRDANIRRIGFVAAEITKCGGLAICAPIAPYDDVRKEVRAAIAPHGGFVLVHVATPLEICEARDRKGLYAKARAGLVPAFTGISDPYEPPADAELTVGAADTPEEAAGRILRHLESEGYLDAI